MKKVIIMKELGETLMEFAKHPVWDMDTNGSKLQIFAQMENHPLVGDLFPIKNGYAGLLHDQDDREYRNPLGYMLCFGKDEDVYIELTTSLNFPFCEDFPRSGVLAPLLERSMGCAVEFETQRLNVNARKTFLYDIYLSERGSISPSVMTFRQNRVMHAVSSLMFVPGWQFDTARDGHLSIRPAGDLGMFA